MDDDLTGVENGSESGPESPVRDGLSTADPLPRDGGPGLPEPPGEEAAREEAAGDMPGGSGGETEMANSAGGIVYKDSGDGGGSSSGTAEEEAVGLNEAAGPAAEREAGTPDNRGLATDTSPSD